MKKILTLSAFICFSHYSNAQNPSPNSNANTQWKINGNNASSTDMFGTLNAQPVKLTVNNVERAILDLDGKFIWKGGKEMIINPSGLLRPEKINPVAAYMLKVGGSGHFDGELNTRQLFVQEYITYQKSLKGPRMDVDTIRMDSTRGIFGHTKIFGDVQIKQNLEVIGDATFKNNLTAERGIMFDNTNGIRYTPATATLGAIYRVGPDVTLPMPPCLAPTQDPWFYFGGRIQLFDPLSNVALTMGSDGRTAIIDASGNNGLKINYYCKNNTAINWGWTLQTDATGNTIATEDGGTIYMGAKTDFQKSIKIGWKESGEVDLNTSIEINQNEALGNGLKLNTYNNGLKFITINNTNFANAPYTVYGGGYTIINAGIPTAKYLTINNASATGTPKESFAIQGNGRTDINAATKTDKYFVINDVSTAGSPVESFVVYGSGTTKTANLNVIGDATISNLIGTGNRGLSVDPAGKIITTANGTAGSNWLLGGNAGNGNTLGTTDNSDLPFITNNTKRMTIDANGHLYFNVDPTTPVFAGANAFARFNSSMMLEGNLYNLGKVAICGDLFENYNAANPSASLGNHLLGCFGQGFDDFNLLVEGGERIRVETPTGTVASVAFDIVESNTSATPIVMQSKFRVMSSGKTQIGVEKVGSGPHTDAMLTVSGKVACKEVRVFNNASGYWADFVFDKSYKLMPLKDVEQFYKTNKHLPNIPTAKDINDNGNDLAKTDALLLQKIEELTIYLVQQQKEIEELKKLIKNK